MAIAHGHRANRLIAALEPDGYAAIQPHLEPVDLHRGMVLYETGTTIAHAYFPHDTLISLVNVLGGGRTVEVAVFGREGVVGLLNALVSRESFGRYIVRVPGVGSRISIDELNEIRRAHPQVRDLLRRYNEAFLAQALQTISCNAVHSVEVRCCSWILHAQDRVNDERLFLTHEFFSELLGVQRSTVSQVLRTLQTEGLIEQGRGYVVITDREKLEQSACECYGRIRHAFERLLPHTYD